MLRDKIEQAAKRATVKSDNKVCLKHKGMY